MSRHTPGPWDVRPCSHGGGLLLRGDSRSHDQHSLQIVPMEDASLIAAAPDMLNALHLAHTALTNTGLINPEAATRAVAEAIAKAEGQS